MAAIHSAHCFHPCTYLHAHTHALTRTHARGHADTCTGVSAAIGRMRAGVPSLTREGVLPPRRAALRHMRDARVGCDTCSPFSLPELKEIWKTCFEVNSGIWGSYVFRLNIVEVLRESTDHRHSFYDQTYLLAHCIWKWNPEFSMSLSVENKLILYFADL